MLKHIEQQYQSHRSEAISQDNGQETDRTEGVETIYISSGEKFNSFLVGLHTMEE